MNNFLDDEAKFNEHTIDVHLIEDTVEKLVTTDFFKLEKLLSLAFAVPFHFVVHRYLTMIRRLRSGKAILPKFVPEYLHKRKGSSYCIILEQDVMIESTWKPGVLYMNSEGVLVVRDKEEFFDGRFEKIAQEPANR